MQQRPVRPENWKGVEDGLEHANVLLKQAKLLEAEVVLREILEFSDTEAQVWHLLGRIQQAEHLHDEAQLSFTAARQYYKQGKSKQRANPISLRLAKLLMAQGDVGAAQEMLAAVLETDPENKQLQQIKKHWQGEVS